MEDAAFYRVFFEESQSIMLVIDPDTGQIVDANQAACRFYGYDATQLKAMRMTDINGLEVEALTASME